jgi:hypothetical protein
MKNSKRSNGPSKRGNFTSKLSCGVVIGHKFIYNPQKKAGIPEITTFVAYLGLKSGLEHLPSIPVNCLINKDAHYPGKLLGGN